MVGHGASTLVSPLLVWRRIVSVKLLSPFPCPRCVCRVLPGSRFVSVYQVSTPPFSSDRHLLTNAANGVSRHCCSHYDSCVSTPIVQSLAWLQSKSTTKATILQHYQCTQPRLTILAALPAMRALLCNRIKQSRRVYSSAHATAQGERSSAAPKPVAHLMYCAAHRKPSPYPMRRTCVKSRQHFDALLALL